MTQITSRFPDAPASIQALPVDPRGYPIPFFVGELNGVPDFRIMNPQHFQLAVKESRCWICGGKLGRMKTFVIGPMCAVNRVSSEPPCHRACAVFAATACPFLTKPLAKRRTEGMPEERGAAGIMIERNPGVTLLWGCLRYKRFWADGWLFEIGAPQDLRWYANGRDATYEEVLESIRTGLPRLVEVAAQDGPEALDDLRKKAQAAMRLLPKAA